MKKVSILLVLALLLCLVPNAWAEGTPEVIEEDGISIVILEPETLEDEPKFELPQALTRIGQAAFEGISAARIKILNNVTAVEARAFASCEKLREIAIPASVTEIDNSAFDGCTGVTIFGETGTEAERIAGLYGFEFVDSWPLTPTFQAIDPTPVLPAVSLR